MAQHSTDTSSDEAQSARRDMNDSYYRSDILIPHTDIHRHAASILHPQSLYHEDFWTAPPTYYRSSLCSHTLDSIPMSEYPVIDMRNSRDFTRSKDHIQLKTNLSQTLIKKAVCERYHVTENFVEIVEYETKVESSPRKTLIIIVPKSTAGFCGLVLETYEDKDQRVPRIMCAHLPLGMVIHDLKRKLKVFLNWKNLAICKDSKVLSDNSPLREFQLEKLERLQVYQFDHQVIDFVYQSGQHCHYRYRVNVNLTKSVGQVKDRLRRQVGDELKKLQSTDKMFLHFTVQEKLVEDDLCMGRVVERFGRDDHVGLHLSSENAISVTLKFNKPLKMKQRMLICKMVCSSAQLRGEIGKLVDHDQKSVKLTLNSKLMEECPDIGKKYGTEWQSGCTVSVGIKKHKTLRIKHPEDGRELVLKMYMLEPVSELKRKVSEAWNLNILNMSLICRGQRMLGSKLLMFYPIKNNMEIQLQLFPHRISFHVRIAFKKRWVKVVVDDSSVSTVDDLLRFCAHKYEYARKCSRAIFNGCCLHKNSSLQEENLKTNDQVVIVHFDQKIKSNGELILIFMGREDGHTIMRCGSVVAGLLLHAAKKTKLQEPEHLDNGALPGDIHIVPEALPDDASKQEMKVAASQPVNEKILTKGEKRALKAMYLRKARALKKAIIARTISEQENTSTGLTSFTETLGLRFETESLTGQIASERPTFYLQDEDEHHKDVKGIPPSDEIGITNGTDDSITILKEVYKVPKFGREDNTDADFEENNAADEDVEENKADVEDVEENNADDADDEDDDVGCSKQPTDTSRLENDGGAAIGLFVCCSACNNSVPVNQQLDIRHLVTQHESYAKNEQHLKCIENCIRKLRNGNSPEVGKSCCSDDYSEDHGNHDCTTVPKALSCESGEIKMECKETVQKQIFDDKIAWDSDKKEGKVIQPVTDQLTFDEGVCHNSTVDFSSDPDGGSTGREINVSACPANLRHTRPPVLTNNNNNTVGSDSGERNLQAYAGSSGGNSDTQQFQYHPCQRRFHRTAHGIHHFHDQDFHTHGHCLFDAVRCPIIQQLLTRESVRMKGRHKYRSEGDTGQSDHAELLELQYLHQNQTVPNLCAYQNAVCMDLVPIITDINTRMLIYVSENVGTKWKQLCRQLEVEETTLDQIEHEYRQLQEQAYKGLFNWTREKGKKATKNALIEALMKVHLTSVAEAINGHTTV